MQNSDIKLNNKIYPLWIWNEEYNNITDDKIYSDVKKFKDRANISGVVLTIWGQAGYLSEDFFNKYSVALKALKENDLQCIVWDENRFPSGRFAENLDRKFWAKSIKMYSYEEMSNVDIKFFKNKEILGAVILNKNTLNRSDVTSKFLKESLFLNIDEKLLVFTCEVFDNGLILIDYLSKESVLNLLENNQNKFYKNFSKYFGNTIQGFFYDEPTMYHIDEGRAITSNFNEFFNIEYGCSPIIMYPALFMDIGEDTYKCRNKIFSLRSKMFSKNYIATMAQWCNKNNVKLFGHLDQEEAQNPTNISGDVIKAFEYQDVPGVDEIWHYANGKTSYKLVVSAAINYNKQDVMCEVFGAMKEEMPKEVLFKEGIDLFLRGVNIIMPHAFWYNTMKSKVNAPPELSYKNKKYEKSFLKFSKMCENIKSHLKGAQFFDLAIMYPIETLYADSEFNNKKVYLGEMNSFSSSYLDTCEKIYNDLKIDNFLLHPEVFLKNSYMKDNRLFINRTSEINIKVLLLCDYEVTNISFLTKLKGYIELGLNVIFIGKLPKYSTDFNDINADFNSLVKEIINNKRCCYLQSNKIYNFESKIREFIENEDVKLITKHDCKLGGLGYIHKKQSNKDVYFFGNSSDYNAKTSIELKGKLNINKCLDIYNLQNKLLDTIYENGYTKFKLNISKLNGYIIETENN